MICKLLVVSDKWYGSGRLSFKRAFVWTKKKTVVQEEPPPIYLICFPIRKMLQILNVLIS